MEARKVTERVWFRLFFMPCCGHLFCSVNPRIPAYCPECGTLVLEKLKTDNHTMIDDPGAELSYIMKNNGNQ